MQSQNEIQQDRLNKYHDKTETKLKKDLDEMILNEKNNNRKLT